jgi:hypothetical protein
LLAVAGVVLVCALQAPMLAVAVAVVVVLY